MAKRKKRETNKAVLVVKTQPQRTPRNHDIDEKIIENFVALQKVMVNLAGKFDDLSTQISKLLSLFEISAKTLAERKTTMTLQRPSKEQEEMNKKMDNLLEQNKILARGLTLLHESREVRELPSTEEATEVAESSNQYVLPTSRSMMPPRSSQMMRNREEYQRSIKGLEAENSREAIVPPEQEREKNS